MVILDTSILIDHLRQKATHTKLERLVAKYGYGQLSVSVITMQELFAGASSRGQEGEILELFLPMKVWPYSESVAKMAGEIERDESRNMDFADAAIAATCVVNNCQLATINKKDFFGIAGLQMVDWE